MVITICMHAWGEYAAMGHCDAASTHSHPISVSGHGNFRNVSAGHAVASARLCATFCFEKCGLSSDQSAEVNKLMLKRPSNQRGAH